MPLNAEQKELVTTSDLSALVFGRGMDFELVPLYGPSETEPAEQARIQAAVRRGLSFCGVLGYRDGQPEARITNVESLGPMTFAGMAWAHVIAEHLRAQPQGDEVEWLARLYSIPDTRPN